jgi:hypothetical protein
MKKNFTKETTPKKRGRPQKTQNKAASSKVKAKGK